MGPRGGMCLMTGIKVGIYMIALGIGYIVAYLSEREEKELQFLGRFIGAVLIVMSGFLITYTILVHLNTYGGMNCPLMR